MTIRLRIIFVLLIFSGIANSQWIPLNPVKSVEPQPDGAEIILQTGYLRLQVCNDSMVHVVYSLNREVPQRPDLIIVKTDWPKTDFTLDTNDPKTVVLSTARLKVKINRQNSALEFQDNQGQRLAE